MTVDVIRLDKDGKRELVPMRWGLIPAWWAKSLKEIPATFNARAESVADKPMFRDAFRGQRCIIPASGFYEWTGDKGNKQPHLFTAADGSPILAFAGLGIAGAIARPARIFCRARSSCARPAHGCKPTMTACR
jgi:putative SOS response-associated peptidase YedK